ncbi:hypothetical protein [Hydrogenovibrio marinus]|uniref:Uncharacterized protein n=1 Tax=Hydrogenovibrio marinus TaxID=28885 RepID=A0A066ZR41_HYDMR|nr:hypothetical protein [Hydrogenovibrio marinus]KDN94704.1 hypothetical protein EI16_12470 [Hydrogenovibrio marinus]
MQKAPGIEIRIITKFPKDGQVEFLNENTKEQLRTAGDVFGFNDNSLASIENHNILILVESTEKEQTHNKTLGVLAAKIDDSQQDSDMIHVSYAKTAHAISPEMQKLLSPKDLSLALYDAITAISTRLQAKGIHFDKSGCDHQFLETV